MLWSLYHFYPLTCTMNRWLMIFRQDMRLTDNTALALACAQCSQLSYLFVLDTTILARGPTNDPRIAFVLDAAQTLDKELKKRGARLSIMYGDPQDCIKRFCQTYPITHLYRNQSYGLWSQTRDQAIKAWAAAQDITTTITPDYLIVNPDEIPVRKVFSPFFNLWLKTLWWSYHPDALTKTSYRQLQDGLFAIRDPHTFPSWPVIDERRKIRTDRPMTKHPHRSADWWRQRLDEFAWGIYDETRNFPARDGSTRLSPYLRFGIISPRQVYNYIVTYARHHPDETTRTSCSTLLNELGWREFWHHIAFHFPHTMNEAFQEKRRNILRSCPSAWIERREKGMTWFPLVDAGMRQLRQENRMHNRVRMVVASFFTKHMHGDRRIGEAVWAQYLLDHDKAINMGNRQWSASVWADPKPVRIFNPNIQLTKFDPTAAYIKRYIPELAAYSPKQLSDPETYDLTASGYPAPMLSHHVQREKTIALYRS